MLLEVPEDALAAGMFNEPMGTHTSRTLMLREIRALLAACGVGSSIDDYRYATVEENAILKATLSTRTKTFRHLRELYALSEAVPIFRALRILWSDDPSVQPIMALLCASARDPLLRCTSDLVLNLKVGDEVAPEQFAEVVEDTFPGRYRPGVLARTGRSIASSWQQAGHLSGRVTKRRSTPQSGPSATAYALFLGHLCGASGEGLFSTLWVRLLDLPAHSVRGQTEAAARLGWLEYRHAGGITDISFRHLGEPEPVST